MSAGKMKTLFSYFTSPGTKKQRKESAFTPNSAKKGEKRKSSTPPGRSAEENLSHGSAKKANNSDCPYAMYDLVWAKVDSYPWWPGIVCKAPASDDFVRKKRALRVHVQFFDDSSSRAWLYLKSLKSFTGPKHAEIPVQNDPKWKASVEKAMDVLNNLPIASRDQVIALMQPSDDEINGKSEDDETMPMSSKKRRLDDSAANGRKRMCLTFSDDSEDEFRPDADHNSDSESASSGVDESQLISEPEEELEIDSPVKVTKKKKMSKPPIAFSTPKTTTPRKLNGVDQSTKSKMLNFSFDDSAVTTKSHENKIWPHLQLDWLRDDKRKDANGNPVSHPDHSSRTLYVPDSFKKNQTPAMRQWWEMKSWHFDSVLFFKVGKFYELYHMDAVIGVNELKLAFMKGDFAHSGFPEIAYGHFSSALIERGYKIARVEQTENPSMMEERCKKMSKVTKFDKVVNREICSITSKGTRTFNFLDGRPTGAGNSYLLSVTEKETAMDCNVIGICFVDTSIGKFRLGQFTDDRHSSRLRTLIAHFPPVQVLYDRETVTAKTRQIFDGCLTGVIKESLRSGSEFWDSSKTIKFLANGGYFTNEADGDKTTHWPEVLRKMLNEDDPLLLSAGKSYDLAIKALGGCIWYLHDCFKEDELLTMKNFEEYLPADYEPSEKTNANRMRKNMVLDSVTLRNLEILENTLGTAEGSLFETMDFCSTQFGKRLFRHWLCAPSCDVAVIEDRLNAVESLRSICGKAAEVAKMMKKLPDLERLLSKIHTQGSARRSKNHPDSRAIFFESDRYSKRKIDDLLSALQGFKLSLEIIDCFEKDKNNMNSEILKQCVTKQSDNGHFPDLKSVLDFFDNAFDHEHARKDGKIIPSKGVDEEFDEAEEEIKVAMQKLDKYLEEQKKHFGCKVTYFGSGKNRFQLEVPESAAKRASNKYELQSQKKGFKRYWTIEIKHFMVQMVAAEEHRSAALKDIMRRIFENFDQNCKKWEAAVQCLSVLDVLLSLMQYSISSQVPMNKPQVLHPEDTGRVFLEIREGQHPSLLKHAADDFIPNDICIGRYDEDNECGSPLVLVTGPNMGGKSTLMRQAGLLAAMAQIGSYVPAEKCCLTVIDRIFTRLGASDRIMMGESTFFVELSETATILQHATKNSLVILDELGRGTATYDGTAIACSVVKELSTNVTCLTLFSTHYHCLVDEFSKDPNVRLGHMACMVENENEEDPTQETVTFLYKFKDGACPKSYGFNAARLAGIPDSVIRRGSRKAKQFEDEFENRKLLRLIMTCTNVIELKGL